MTTTTLRRGALSAPPFDRNDTQRKIAAVNLVDLVQQDCPDLHRAGKRHYKCRCPFHAEYTASFAVYTDGSGFHCYGCGKDGDAANYLQETRGYTFKQALAYLSIGEGPKPPYQPLPLRPAPPYQPSDSAPLGELLATYDYKNVAGELVYQVLRYQNSDGKKTFRQRRPDGRGGWVWNLDGTERLIYRLPELLAADPAKQVFIVEGEKDADRLAGLGLVVTCNSGGAGRWPDEQAHHLTGRAVVILPDNDTNGTQHAGDVAASLSGVAANVKILNLPGLPEKGDVSDYLSRTGFGAEALLALAEVGRTVDGATGEIAGDVSPDTAGLTERVTELEARIHTIDNLLLSGDLQPTDRLILYGWQRYCEQTGFEPGQDRDVDEQQFADRWGISKDQAGRWLDRLGAMWTGTPDDEAQPTSWREHGALARHQVVHDPILNERNEPKINRNTGKPMFRTRTTLTCQALPFDTLQTVRLVSPPSPEGNKHGGARKPDPRCPHCQGEGEPFSGLRCKKCHKGYTATEAHEAQKARLEVVTRKQDAFSLHVATEPVTRKQDALVCNEAAPIVTLGEIAPQGNLSGGFLPQRDTVPSIADEEWYARENASAGPQDKRDAARRLNYSANTPARVQSPQRVVASQPANQPALQEPSEVVFRREPAADFEADSGMDNRIHFPKKPNPLLKIEWSNYVDSGPCPICKQLYSPIENLQLFMVGNSNPVCYDCGQIHAPELTSHLLRQLGKDQVKSSLRVIRPGLTYTDSDGGLLAGDYDTAPLPEAPPDFGLSYETDYDPHFNPWDDDLPVDSGQMAWAEGRAPASPSRAAPRLAVSPYEMTVAP